MKCKKCQDVILTDYVDNLLSLDDKKAVDNHLKECVLCSDFCEKARQSIDFLSENKTLTAPPAYLWRNIKEKIEKEAFVEHPFGERVNYLLGILNINSPRLVFSSMAIILLVAMTVTFNYRKNRNKNELSLYVDNQIDQMAMIYDEENQFLISDEENPLSTLYETFFG